MLHTIHKYLTAFFFCLFKFRGGVSTVLIRGILHYIYYLFIFFKKQQLSTKQTNCRSIYNRCAFRLSGGANTQSHSSYLNKPADLFSEPQ